MSTGFDAILNYGLTNGLTDNASEISGPSLETNGLIADFADIYTNIDGSLATSWSNSDSAISTIWTQVS